MGQSCGTGQALQVSGDPRVTTTVLLNGGPGLGASRAPAAAPAKPVAQARGSTATPARAERYVRGARQDGAALRAVRARGAEDHGDGSAQDRAKFIDNLHGPVALINGGPSDLAYKGAVSGYEAIQKVMALHAWQDVGHYPATFRQPNGGAFAVAVNAWLNWHLKGDKAASKMFVGADCGLCKDPQWHVQIKNLP